MRGGGVRRRRVEEVFDDDFVADESEEEDDELAERIRGMELDAGGKKRVSFAPMPDKKGGNGDDDEPNSLVSDRMEMD